jgi:hypothetical protein
MFLAVAATDLRVDFALMIYISGNQPPLISAIPHSSLRKFYFGTCEYRQSRRFKPLSVSQRLSTFRSIHPAWMHLIERDTSTLGYQNYTLSIGQVRSKKNRRSR